MASMTADIVGNGLVVPFRRGPADFVAAGEVEQIQSMIAQVLGTRAATDRTPGELPWRGDFGSLLHLLKHKNNDETTQELARVYVVEALARWVPQVRIKAVTVERQKGPNGELTIMLIRLRYDLIGLKRSGTEVQISDVDQAVALAA